MRGTVLTVGELKEYLKGVPDDRQIVVGWNAEEVKGATWVRTHVLLGVHRFAGPQGSPSVLIAGTG